MQISRNIRYGLTAASAAAASVLVPLSRVWAVTFGELPDTGGGGLSLVDIITNIIEGILVLLGIIAVIVIVIAGLRLLVGGADEGQRQKARDQILWAVVGLIIIVMATAIVRFVEENILT